MAKVTVRAKQAWRSRSLFSLDVSMGSQNHEGEALAAIVEAINAGPFTGGVINVADTLNRYRYIDAGLSEADALARARSEGKDWLERNKAELSKLRMPNDVRRWDVWLNAPEYAETRALFERLYRENRQLACAIEHDLERFHARHGNHDISERSRSLSRAYFLEELAVHSLLLKSYRATALYPGKQLECFRVIREGCIPGAPQSLVDSTYSRLVVHSFEKPLAVNQNTQTRKRELA